MSLDINVYTKDLSDDIIPQIVKRLNDYEMVVEVHPDFSFENQTGFLPFKFRLKNPPLEVLNDKELISGFELYIDDFNLQEEKEKLKPKLSFIDKLIGKKTTEIPFASPAIEDKLKNFDKVITFVWHAGDSFELRFASLTSAILTELTNGICYYPADDIWYETKGIVEETYKEIKAYEQSLKGKEIKYHEFDEW
ncbi:hypothetical protein [Pontibacter virosus]|uniref:Uncharacterized protein n=1 Tax=Pontibacter virosus TaxID=1765052 RepID=A0A2U1AV34_9BACT|nr:hypothetical protein [Pontibacter virosus]PVY40253.1 hypothetical protein C8E01_108147 [Pontibacter virosus]PVY40260.1 hypothetical protein C8E01_108154 [Pontibacter virosus]